MKTTALFVGILTSAMFAVCFTVAEGAEKPQVQANSTAASRRAAEVGAETHLGATEEDYRWWREARFGIFIHWGPGALVHRNSLSWQRPENRPGWDELGYMADHNDPPIPLDQLKREAEKYANQGGAMPPEIYNQLYRIFNPVKFNADEIAEMAKAAGAGYIVFTTKHHDGFCMWDSAFTDYDMMSTPCKRDICGELARACHKRGLRLLWYYSIVDMHDARYDVRNPKPYEDYLCNQIRELMTKYGPIEGIWWDGGRIKRDNVRLFTMINQIHPGALTNGRAGRIPFGISFGSPEQRLGSFQMDRPWETCAVVEDSSWIWAGGKDIKSVNTCLQMLIGCAIGDGNLLLNFSPRPDGSIHPKVKETYLGMGKFLARYGGSIYKTRGGPYKPGRWGGSTRRGNKVWLHITQRWPAGKLQLPPLPARIVSCTALTGGEVHCRQDDQGVLITLDPKYHAVPDTIIELTLDRDALDIEPIDTLEEKSLTIDARATASSSVNPRIKRGAPETVIQYSFETGKIKKEYGEEAGIETSAAPKSGKCSFTPEEIARIKKIIGTSHRGHFWRYWKPKADDPQPWLEVALDRPATFQKVGIRELYGQVRGFELQAWQDGGWKTFYKGDTLDDFFVHLAEPVTAQRVRIVILGNNGEVPSIVSFDLFE